MPFSPILLLLLVLTTCVQAHVLIPLEQSDELSDRFIPIELESENLFSPIINDRTRQKDEETEITQEVFEQSNHKRLISYQEFLDDYFVEDGNDELIQGVINVIKDNAKRYTATTFMMPSNKKYEGDMTKLVSATASGKIYGFYPEPIFDSESCQAVGSEQVTCSLKNFQTKLVWGRIHWHFIESMNISFGNDFNNQLWFSINENEEQFELFPNFVEAFFEAARNGIVEIKDLGYFNVPDPYGRKDDFVFSENIESVTNSTRQGLEYIFPVDENLDRVTIPEGYDITDDCVVSFDTQTLDCIVAPRITGIEPENLSWIHGECYTIRLTSSYGTTRYQKRPVVKSQAGIPETYSFSYDYILELSQSSDCMAKGEEGSTCSYGQKLWLNTGHASGSIWLHGGFQREGEWNGGGNFAISGRSISQFMRNQNFGSDKRSIESEFCDIGEEVDFQEIIDGINETGDNLWAGMLGELNQDYPNSNVDDPQNLDFTHKESIYTNYVELFVEQNQDEVDKIFEERYAPGIGGWEFDKLFLESDWTNEDWDYVENVPHPPGSEPANSRRYDYSGNVNFSTGLSPMEMSVITEIEIAEGTAGIGTFITEEAGVLGEVTIPEENTITLEGGTLIRPSQWDDCLGVPFNCPEKISTFEGCQYDVNGAVTSCQNMPITNNNDGSSIVCDIAPYLCWNSRRGTRDKFDIVVSAEYSLVLNMDYDKQARYIKAVKAEELGQQQVSDAVWYVLSIPEKAIIAGMELFGLDDEEENLLLKYQGEGLRTDEASIRAFSESARNEWLQVITPLVVLTFTPTEWANMSKVFVKGTVKASKVLGQRTVKRAWYPRNLLAHKKATLFQMLRMQDGFISELKLWINLANEDAIIANKMQEAFVKRAKAFEKKMDLQTAVTIALSKGEQKAMIRSEVAQRYRGDIEELMVEVDELKESYDFLLEKRVEAYKSQQEVSRMSFEAGIPDVYAQNWSYFFRWYEAENFEGIQIYRKSGKDDLGRRDYVVQSSIDKDTLGDSWFDFNYLPAEVQNMDDGYKKTGKIRQWLAGQYTRYRAEDLKSPLFRDLADMPPSAIVALEAHAKDFEKVRINDATTEIKIMGLGVMQNLLSMREYILDYIFLSKVELGRLLKGADRFFNDRTAHMALLKKNVDRLEKEAVTATNSGASQTEVLRIIKEKDMLFGRHTALKAGVDDMETERLELAIGQVAGEISESYKILRQVNEEIAGVGGPMDWKAVPRGREPTAQEKVLFSYKPKIEDAIEEPARFYRKGDGPAVAVIGSREITKATGVGKIVMEMNPCAIVWGCAKGGDAIGLAIAKAFDIPVWAHPAPWDKFKTAFGSAGLAKTAGFVRNTQIAYVADKIVVIGSSSKPTNGTLDTMQKAWAMDKPVYFFDIDGKSSGWLDSTKPFWPKAAPSSPVGIQVVNRKNEIDATNPANIWVMRETSVPNGAKDRLGGDGVFGNPYAIGKDGTREEVIEKFKQSRMPELRKTPEFQQLVQKYVSEGKVNLVCCCKPQPCHGDIIAEEVVKAAQSGKAPNVGSQPTPAEMPVNPEIIAPEVSGLPLDFHPHLMDEGGVKRKEREYLVPFSIERGLEDYHESFPANDEFWRKVINE